MTITKRKKSKSAIWEKLQQVGFLKLLVKNINNQPLVNSLKAEASAISGHVNSQKIENILDLLYKLFLYSVIGLFAKIVTKLFKF